MTDESQSPPESGPLPAPAVDGGVKKLTLRQNFSWMFCASVLAGVLRWALLLILAKMGGPVMVGTWVLAQAICFPIMYLTRLNLETVLITDVRREQSIGEYLFLRLATNVLMIAAIAGVCLWRGLDAYTTTCTVLFGLSASILAFRDVVLSVPIRNERTKVNARSQLMLAVVSFLGVAGALWLTGSLVWALVAIVVFRLAVAVGHDLPAAYSSERSFHPDDTRSFVPRYSPGLIRLAWTALPAGLSVAALSYATNVPVYYLEGSHGRQVTGYYGGLNAFVAALNIVLTPLFSSIGPRLSRLFSEGDCRGFVRLCAKVVVVFLVLGVVGVAICKVAAPWIISLALGAKFAHLTREFVWVMVMGAGWSIFALLCYILQTTRRFWLLLFMQIFILLSTIGLSSVLIPEYALWGVIWVRLIIVAGGTLIAAGVLTAVLLGRRSEKAS